jgi:hypothetical protein
VAGTGQNNETEFLHVEALTMSLGQEKHTPQADVFVDERSVAAFYRNLPKLLKTHLGQWVAYHGDDCLGFGCSKTELFQQSLRRGLREHEFVVLFVSDAALADNEEVDLPWVS